MQEGSQDAELCARLAKVLELYPALAGALPAQYPLGFATVEGMKAFDVARKSPDGFWHLLNLPLSLYMATLDGFADGRDLGRSLLATLDSFCASFSSCPRFKGVLSPLWQSAWKDDDPEFWSVLGHAYTALGLASKGFTIESFAEPLPAETTKNVDIFVRTPRGDHIYLDLVMKHRPRFTTAEEARVELLRHANDKIGNKFGPVLQAMIPVTVLVVVVAAGRQLEVLLENPEVLKTIMGPEVDRREGIAASFQALIGNRGADGRLSWYLAAVDELVAIAAQRRG